MFLSASLVIGTAVFASLPVKVEAGPGFSVCFPTCVAVCVGGATAATATIGAVAAAGPCMEACMVHGPWKRKSCRDIRLSPGCQAVSRGWTASQSKIRGLRIEASLQ